MSVESDEYFKKIKDQMSEWEIPKLDVFDTFTLMGPYSLNGYVVIPDYLTTNFLADIYEDVDDGPIGGITYGGYVTSINGDLQLVSLDQHYIFYDHILTEKQVKKLNEVKTKCLPVLGFDDNHIHQNQLSGLEGADYLANELRKIKTLDLLAD